MTLKTPVPAAGADTSARHREARINFVLLLLALALPALIARVWLFVPPWVPGVASVGLAGGATVVLRQRARGLAPLVACLASMVTWVFAYGTVVFDNPTADEITFEVDDGASVVRVPPGKHAVKTLPVGERRFTARLTGGGESFSGEVGSNGRHLATPSNDTCYGLVRTTDGASTSGRAQADEHLAGRRFYTLQKVDDYFEPPPTSVTTRTAGMLRRRLERSSCRHK
ncbi:MAG: hypothetical protein HOW73_08880 [Polyangiaceae bacterium]|nr:hypothetical protein [Polyangiaceae bacterium]